MTHKELEVRQLPGLFKEAFSEFSRDNVLRLSAALSYYSLFSIAPLLMIAIGIVGWVYGDKARRGPRLGGIEPIRRLAGRSGSGIGRAKREQEQRRGDSRGFVTLLVGASSVFGAVERHAQYHLEGSLQVGPRRLAFRPHVPAQFRLGPRRRFSAPGLLDPEYLRCRFGWLAAASFRHPRRSSRASSVSSFLFFWKY